jgi:hypothetical protein
MRLFQRSLLLLAFFSLLVSSALRAQNTTGEIDGTVVDSSGASIPGAKVVITDQTTKVLVRTVTTGKSGEFAIALLNVGTYEITGSAAGFEATTISNIELHVGDQLTISPKLKPGAQDVTVQVDALQLAPDTENATMGSVVNATEVTELALNTRNFEQMVLLQPGVAYDGDDDNYPGQLDFNGNLSASRISVNGLRPTQLSWSLDGGDVLNQETSSNVAIFPSIESIQQIRTLRNSYGAQYGGGGSAQAITVTKSGTPTFHGDVFAFIRNQYLNANEYFNLVAVPVIPRPPDKQNIFGASVGGPVFIPHLYPRDRSHTFFFFTEELKRITLFPTDRLGDMPTQQEVLGHEPYISVNAKGVGTCPTPNGSTTLYVDQGAAAQDPNFPCYLTTAIDPVAQAYIKDIFQPILNNYTLNDPTNINGLILQLKATSSQTQETFRLDHQWSPRISSFIRYTFDPDNRIVPAGIGRTSTFPGVGTTTAATYGEQITPHTTFQISNSTVLEVGYSYVSYQIRASPIGSAELSNSPDIAAAVHLPFPNTTGRIPTLSITGGVNIGATGPKEYINHTQQVFANFTKQAGRHTLYFGANYEHFYSTVNAGSNDAGLYTYTGQFYDAFPKFLVGELDAFQQSSIDPVSHIAQNVTEFYVQDNWKALSRLTLNAGMRYTIEAQPYDAAGHLGGFSVPAFNVLHTPAFNPNYNAKSNPNYTGAMCLQGVTLPECMGIAPNAAYDPNNGIINGGTNSPYGKAVARQTYLNFAPRVGFAYDVYGDGKTAIRGGYGIFFNHYPLTLYESAVYGNPLYAQTVSTTSTSAGSASNPGINSAYPLDISGTNPHWSTPYTESWSLDLQQTLAPNWMLDMAYVGNNTQHLQGEEDLNQPLLGEYLKFGINGTVPGTNTGLIDSGDQDQELNPIRPYPGWGAIRYNSTRFFGDYNGLQVQTVKRWASHSVISVSYTWSRSMANSLGESGTDPQNRYDLHAEWGPTNFDHRDLFTAHYVYQLPFYLHDHAWKGNILGGWQLSGIYRAYTGSPLTPGANQRDPGGQGVITAGSNAAQRPNVVAGANPNRNAPHKQFAWIDTTVADNYVLGVPGGTVGNARIGSINAPNYNNLTFDLFKNFRITERLRLQFRGEAFNALNHVNFRGVQVGVRNGGYGQVTTAFDMRQMQLGAKLYF